MLPENLQISCQVHTFVNFSRKFLNLMGSYSKSMAFKKASLLDETWLKSRALTLNALKGECDLTKKTSRGKGLGPRGLEGGSLDPNKALY